MFAQKLEKMRKILIPTDFTVESLELAEYAILNFPDTKLDIIFIVGYSLPDTRWGVTHFSEREQINNQLSDSFKDSQRHFVREHKNNIEAISFELFTGVNLLAFQNFIDRLGIENAIIPKDKSLRFQNNKWFNTTRFIKKTVKNIIEVPVELKEETQQRKYSLISLFNL